MSADRGLFPMQPFVAARGALRFQKNAIVDFLLAQGPHDLNSLAVREEFTEEDWTQFAQLIGYSVSGFCDLSYVSEAAKDIAEAAAERWRRREKPDGPRRKLEPPETVFEAWGEVRGKREALAATLSPVQRKALDELLDAWRTAHLRDVLAVGGPKIERVARKLLEET